MAPFANDILLGLWTMAGPLAAFMLQKVGAATIGELLASAVEAIIGGQWGPSTLISGFVLALQILSNMIMYITFGAMLLKNWSLPLNMSKRI